MLSIVLITSLPEKANALSEALGWGPNNFSVPLTNNKFGLHTWATQNFVDILESGEAPEGFSAEDFSAILDDLIKSVRPDSANHFEEVLNENNLSIVTPDSEPSPS